MTRLAAAAVIAFFVAPALAAETPPYPTSGIVQNTRADDALYVECEPPAGTALTCRFTALTFTRRSADAIRPFPRSECGQLDAFARIYRDGEVPPGADAQAFRDRFARRSPAQQADIAALVDAFAAYCKSGDKANEDRLVEVMRRRESRSCTLDINTYRLDFDWEAPTGRWVSRSQEPSDPCGPMRVAAFERPAGSPGNAPWSYRITDYAGKPGANAACTQPAGSGILYSPQPEDIYLTCDYIRLSD